MVVDAIGDGWVFPFVFLFEIKADLEGYCTQISHEYRTIGESS